MSNATTRPGYLGDQPYAIAVDTETTGFEWHGEDWPFMATVSDFRDDKLYILTPEQNETKALRDRILEAEVLIFHNATFDIMMLVSHGVVTIDEILSKEIHDTEVLARVVNSREPNYRLKSLAQKYVDADADDGEVAVKEAMLAMGLIRKVDQRTSPRGAYYEVWKAHPDVIETYALKDTRITYDLYYALKDLADEDAWKVYETIERPLIPILARMEYRGISIDADRVADLKGVHEVEYERLLEALYEMNGEPFEVNSKTELIPFLEANGVKLTYKTESGELRIDKGALSAFSGNAAVDTLLDWRAHEKLLTTYLGPMSDTDVAHPRFIQVGAWTGRMSCRAPNFQNIPSRSGPEMRSMIVPKEGHVFVVADYSSIELRLLAYYMGDDGLKQLIEDGDPFIWLGTEIYGTDDQSQWPVKRSSLKNGFYAMTYGAGGPKLASTIGGGMTPEQGRELRKNMEAALGNHYRVLNGRIRKAVQSRGFVKTIAGRRQLVPKDKAYVGLNSLIQGSAADIMKRATFLAAEYLEYMGAYPVLLVHDEIVCEVPEDRAEEALEQLKAAMEEAATNLDARLSLTAEGSVCPDNYGQAKD